MFKKSQSTWQTHKEHIIKVKTKTLLYIFSGGCLRQLCQYYSLNKRGNKGGASLKALGLGQARAKHNLKCASI